MARGIGARRSSELYGGLLGDYLRQAGGLLAERAGEVISGQALEEYIQGLIPGFGTYEIVDGQITFPEARAPQGGYDGLLGEMFGAGMSSPMGGLLHTVWHGSPHRWDVPDISKVGTGEGAQAYGHGFYSSESPEVAKGYANALSTDTLYVKGTPIRAKDVPGPYYEAATSIASQGFDKALKDIDDQLAFLTPSGRESALARKEQIRAIGPDVKWQKDNAQVYKLDIPDEDIARYLDWDKPLSEQSKEVQAALKRAYINSGSINTDKIMRRIETEGFSDGFSLAQEGNRFYAQMDNAAGQDYGFFDSKDQALNWIRNKVNALPGNDPSGADIYRAITRENGEDGIGQAISSQMLSDAGIPGIRYLDGGSRGAGEGTYNYVTFDPSRIRVLERNGQGLLGNLEDVPRDQQIVRFDGGVSASLPKVRKVVRYETESGRGLMNNDVLDRMRLTDDEEDELMELLDFGLQQPRDVPAGAAFAFTEDGEKQHRRLLELLKKASKEKVIRREYSIGDSVWESPDGQVAFLPD